MDELSKREYIKAHYPEIARIFAGANEELLGLLIVPGEKPGTLQLNPDFTFVRFKTELVVKDASGDSHSKDGFV